MHPVDRLLAILDAVLNTSNLFSFDKAWEKAFQLDEKSPTFDDDVARLLIALRNEIDRIGAELKARSVPEELILCGLPRLRQAASTAIVKNPINSIGDILSRPDTRISILWARFTLQDFIEIDHESVINGLKERISDLESFVSGSAASMEIKSFISRQIETLRDAMKLYPVQGERPIRDALRQVYGATVVEDVGPRIGREDEANGEGDKRAFDAFINFCNEIAPIAGSKNFLTSISYAQSLLPAPASTHQKP